MSRRRFMATLGSIGLSGGALKHMTQEKLAKLTSDPSDEVPRLSYLKHKNHDDIKKGKPIEREPIYYTIPRDEWRFRESVNDAAVALKNKLKQEMAGQTGRKPKDSDLNISTFVTGRVNGQQSQREIEVRLETVEDGNGNVISEPPVDLDWVKEKVPDQAKGSVGKGRKEYTRSDIPVSLKATTIKQQASFNGEYRPVPGGCQIQRIDDGGLGTITTPAMDQSNYDFYYLTAGHFFGQQGIDFAQPNSGWIDNNKIGVSHVSISTWDFDAGRIEANDISSFYSIAGSSAGSYDENIRGIRGFDVITDNKGDTSFELELQGRTTGRNSGHIVGYEPDIQKFYIDVDSDDGDSGGPHFYSDGSDAYIMGVHAWGGGSNAGATYSGRVEETLNVWI